MATGAMDVGEHYADLSTGVKLWYEVGPKTESRKTVIFCHAR